MVYNIRYYKQEYNFTYDDKYIDNIKNIFQRLNDISYTEMSCLIDILQNKKFKKISKTYSNIDWLEYIHQYGNEITNENVEEYIFTKELYSFVKSRMDRILRDAHKYLESYLINKTNCFKYYNVNFLRENPSASYNVFIECFPGYKEKVCFDQFKQTINKVIDNTSKYREVQYIIICAFIESISKEEIFRFMPTSDFEKYHNCYNLFTQYNQEDETDCNKKLRIWFESDKKDKDFKYYNFVLEHDGVEIYMDASLPDACIKRLLKYKKRIPYDTFIALYSLLTTDNFFDVAKKYNDDIDWIEFSKMYGQIDGRINEADVEEFLFHHNYYIWLCHKYDKYRCMTQFDIRSNFQIEGRNKSGFDNVQFSKKNLEKIYNSLLNILPSEYRNKTTFEEFENEYNKLLELRLSRKKYWLTVNRPKILSLIEAIESLIEYQPVIGFILEHGTDYEAIEPYRVYRRCVDMSIKENNCASYKNFKNIAIGLTTCSDDEGFRYIG